MIENNKGAKQFAQTCILIALTAVFILRHGIRSALPS